MTLTLAVKIVFILKRLFQVVTSHAVKVPVTRELNAKLQGYLPIHCVYQLLKSRAFSKHKVHIKVG